MAKPPPYEPSYGEVALPSTDQLNGNVVHVSRAVCECVRLSDPSAAKIFGDNPVWQPAIAEACRIAAKQFRRYSGMVNLDITPRRSLADINPSGIFAAWSGSSDRLVVLNCPGIVEVDGREFALQSHRAYVVPTDLRVEPRPYSRTKYVRGLVVSRV